MLQNHAMQEAMENPGNTILKFDPIDKVHMGGNGTRIPDMVHFFHQVLPVKFIQCFNEE